MTKTYLILLLIFLSGTAVHAQKFNTEAVNRFWQLVDRVKSDRPISDSLWNSYYNLTGNKQYIENNRDPKQALEHRRYLELVFRPSMKDSLPELRNKKSAPGNDFLANLLYIHDHEQAMQQYTPEIISPAYLKNCIRLAKKYLPVGHYNPIPGDLTIYIHAMTNDAAVQSPNMYFGLTAVYNMDRFRKGTLAAHELHHQLRVNREIERKVSYPDSTSFAIIDQVNNEGTADLIDKTLAAQYRTKMFDAESLVHWLLDDAQVVIKRLDSCLMNNARPGTKSLSYRDFRKITLYSSGHIPGFYMSRVIVRNGGEQQLIRHCDNPFSIFYLYNEAAKKDKEHPARFSRATIAYLKRLEKKVFTGY